MRSEIYTVNTNTQSLNTNDTINLGSVIRRFGGFNLSNGTTITTRTTGFSNVDAVVTASPTSTGTVSVTAYYNSNPIPGATSSFTVAAGNVVSIPISAVIRKICGCENSEIVLKMTGVAGTVTNVTLRVYN